MITKLYNCLTFVHSSNHADSDYITDELRNPKIPLETYRALQIVCTCFNDYMSPF